MSSQHRNSRISSAFRGCASHPFKLGAQAKISSEEHSRERRLLLLLYDEMTFAQRLRCLLSVTVLIAFPLNAESSCTKGCDLALASYYVWQGSNLSFIAKIFSANQSTIMSYNPTKIPNIDYIRAGNRINVPFTCDCIDNEILGRKFEYDVVRDDTYTKIARRYYSNLTTPDWVQRFNTYAPTNIPLSARINVTVNCSCGNRDISDKYGLFITYPLRPGETLGSIESEFNLSTDLLRRYNPNSNFSSGSGLVFIPAKDVNGTYRPLEEPSRGMPGGAIAAIIVGSLAGILILVFLYYKLYRGKKAKKAMLLSTVIEDVSVQRAPGSGSYKMIEFNGLVHNGNKGLAGITVDKSVEFSYEELAKASDDFSMANKIGEGGFGSVYYAELRGEKTAIKKMDMQASKEFLAELKVLTRVHHVNLVRLIGYCVEGSLFLIYEYIENGNLSQHLRGSGKDPLPWYTRVQIALDSARGLEYIHEHTVPVYVHRDIKSANILVDKNFHGKVADFGLTKLTEVGNTSLPTRLAGTFGYMPPEYAQYGDVSPKIDVYAFGVVLYELVSAKEAIVKVVGSEVESKGLVSMFDDVLNRPNLAEELTNVVDPRMGVDYPLDSVLKMALLAKACTHENPQARPSMRSVVVALMGLSSSTDEWDVKSLYENRALVNLMPGR